jgi:hypothetical protein
MGSKKKLRRKQHQQENNIEKESTSKKLSKSLIFVSVVILIVAGISTWTICESNSNSIEKVEQNTSIQSRPLPKLIEETKSAFAKPADITTKTTLLISEKPNDPLNLARINLMCAKGLPLSENIDIDKCLDVLKKMAARVKSETARYLYKYKAAPKDYYNSEAYFRMLTLITVLQQDFKIKYNPELISINPTIEELKKPFTNDSRDVFLHGLLTGKHQGSCASMPVLYLIIGRMLGYPLKLVSSKAHLFLRWDDKYETINLEATGPGLSIRPDSYYRKFPFVITPEEEKYKYFLRSMSPEEELAVFLESRAGVCRAIGNMQEVLWLYKDILNLTPNHPYAKKYIAHLSSKGALDKAMESQQKRMTIQQQRLASIPVIKMYTQQYNLKFQEQLHLLNTDYLNQMSNKNAPKNYYSIYYSEISHCQRLHGMITTELQSWENQMIGGIGAPVTAEQIKMLLTKKTKVTPKFPEGYLERQKYKKYQRIRERSPNAKYRIARLEEEER